MQNVGVASTFHPRFQLIKFYNSPMQWANTAIISALLMENLRVKSCSRSRQIQALRAQSEREIGDIYLIFQLKVSICWMNRIYVLNKGLGSELVKIAPHFFFSF